MVIPGPGNLEFLVPLREVMLGCIPILGVRKRGRSPLHWDKEVLWTLLSVLGHSLCRNYFFLKGKHTDSTA